VDHDPHIPSIEEEKKPWRISLEKVRGDLSSQFPLSEGGRGKVVPQLSTFYANYKDLRSTIKEYQGGLTKRSNSQEVNKLEYSREN
jgi:hypothetical protein